MKIKTTYVQMPDNCFVELMPEFKTECCDCGLVHYWKLKFIRKKPGFQIKRDNRATAQRRRKRKRDEE